LIFSFFCLSPVSPLQSFSASAISVTKPDIGKQTVLTQFCRSLLDCYTNIERWY
jgi:hypothetical protein